MIVTAGGRRRLWTYAALCSACCSLLLAVRAVRADASDDDKVTAESPQNERIEAARTHFQKGVQLYDEGDYPAAIAEFQRAYTLQPTYRLLYNFGQVSYELQDYAGAERHFRAYLLDGGSDIPASRRSEVEHELEVLGSHIGVLHLQTDRAGARLSVDERLVGTTPLEKPVHVNPGRRRVGAELAGYARITETVDVKAGDERIVRLEFGPHLALSPAEGASAPPAATAGTNWALWTGVATGAFALGAIGLGYWAHHDAQAYNELITQPTTRQDLDDLAARTNREALFSDILLCAAVAAGTVTVILLLTAEHRDSAPAHSPEARPESRRALAGL
jgi:tetratricopeptide (TPR) repeat protein